METSPSNTYSKGDNILSKEERKNEDDIRIRKFNNWCKTLLLDGYAIEGDSLIDLGCGKCGDLQKWNSCKLKDVVGIDNQKVLLEEAERRYEELISPSFSFHTCVSDCFGSFHAQVFKSMYDVCTCLFALQYAFESETKLDNFFSNVGFYLKPSTGKLLLIVPDSNVIVKKIREHYKRHRNSLLKTEFYTIEFSSLVEEFCISSPPPPPLQQLKSYGNRYTFSFGKAVQEVDEYLVCEDALIKVANKYGFTLSGAENLTHFYDQQKETEKGKFLWSRMMQRNMDSGGDITSSEWDACYLYKMFVFEISK